MASHCLIWVVDLVCEFWIKKRFRIHHQVILVFNYFEIKYMIRAIGLASVFLELFSVHWDR